MIEKLKSYHLILFLILLATGLFFFYLKIQPQLTHSFSPLFDANKYLEVYQYFDGQTEELKVIFPINSRILIPWLASLFPFENPASDFLAVHFIFMHLSIVTVFMLWKKYNLPIEYILTGFFWFFIHWVGIIRLNIFDPISIDVPLYFFHALLLLLAVKRNFVWLIIIGPLATIQKESFIGLLIALLIIEFYIIWKKKSSATGLIWIISALFLSIVVRELVNMSMPPSNPGRSSLVVVLFHIKETLNDPFRLVRWVNGVFTAYGPLLLLAFWFKIKKTGFQKEDPYLAGLSIVHLILSFIGGGDFTRLAFLGFPFVMTWILISLKNVRSFQFKAAFIFGLPLLKVFSNIPDPSRTGWDKFNNWYPEFANPVIVLLWLGYGALCILVYRTIDKKLAKLP